MIFTFPEVRNRTETESSLAEEMDQTQILETLKSNFLFNFRTGNVMVDTFVTGIIIMLSTYLLNMSNNLFNFDWVQL